MQNQTIEVNEFGHIPSVKQATKKRLAAEHNAAYDENAQIGWSKATFKMNDGDYAKFVRSFVQRYTSPITGALTMKIPTKSELEQVQSFKEQHALRSKSNYEGISGLRIF